MWQKFSNLSGYLLDKLTQRLPIGGLEISDSALRYLRADGQNLVTFSVRLPLGIITEGTIKDRNNLLVAFQQLHSRIDKNPGTILPVIVSLPAAAVYTQSFTVPLLGEEETAEAAALNLQMISPIEQLETAYYSWQKLGQRKGSVNQQDILGAFVSRSFVDDLNAVLKEANFYPAAFEFPALAIARLFKILGDQAQGVFMAVNVFTDGLDFLLIQDGDLYFSYFRSWRSIQGDSRQIKLKYFQDAIKEEVQKVVNFAGSHFSEPIRAALLISQGLEKEIVEIIQSKFNFKIIPLRASQYPYLVPLWFTSLGAALRGAILRSEDNLISLAGKRAEQEYYQNQALAFIPLWRNFLAAALGVLLLAFVVSDAVLARINSGLQKQVNALAVLPENQEAAQLEEAARKFNNSVAGIKNIKSQSRNWSPFLEKIFELAGKGVFIDKTAVSALGAPVNLSGRGTSEKAILDFKNRLVAQPQLSDVTLRLTDIKPAGGGLFSFNLTFVIKNLDL